MKTILLLEHQAGCAHLIHHILEQIKTDVHIFYADCISDAYRYAMENMIDLFLLNVSVDKQNISDASGIGFAERLRGLAEYETAPIIFISSVADTKLYAYSHLHCYAYIEKPFDHTYLQQTIESALRLSVIRKEKQNYHYKLDGILYLEKIKDIVYAKCAQRQIVLCTTHGNISLNYKSIKQLAYELGVDRFLQCSRFALVNRDYIKAIDYVNRYVLLPKEYGKLELGETFRKALMRAILTEE